MSLDDIATSQKEICPDSVPQEMGGKSLCHEWKRKSPKHSQFPWTPSSDGFRRGGLGWVLADANSFSYISDVCGLAEQRKPWDAQYPVGRLPCEGEGAPLMAPAEPSWAGGHAPVWSHDHPRTT